MIPVHFHRYNYHILCSEFLSRLCKKIPVQNRTFLIRFQISDHFVSDHFLYVLSYSMVTKPKIPVEILVRPSKEKKKKSINQSCQFSINHSQNCIYLFFFFPQSFLHCSSSFYVCPYHFFTIIVHVFIIIKFNHIFDLFSDMHLSPEYKQTSQIFCHLQIALPCPSFHCLGC